MERETDRAPVMPLPHSTDVARAGGTDEGGALPGYVREKRSLLGTSGLCVPVVLPCYWCACVLLYLSWRPLALAVCFLGCRRPSASVDPDIEVIALFAQLLWQRIWAVPW
jgi:hypothetical protein